ncbi:MAG: acyl-ACP--UDP-N-acetylglucosamine O-acyltransferase [Bacteroidetes bacterium]|nr:acyl-ACP--UDP-N-acetylglucosamine O-acyltransferase [Bacteroidota bacterium]MBU2585186.1 acyl-ACP--UDP-N-acetylglucosamine O-acyltransferase [Bacteroidota bacterium]
MLKIHPSSIVSPKAEIADDVEIGPFCIIDEDVKIGSGTKLLSHVTIYKHARIGNNNKIFPGTVIAAVPQDLKFEDEFTEVFIGDNNTIRECVTISRATKTTKKTIIGSGCLLMAYAHVAHDCIVENNCIIANGTELAGHVHVEEFVILGGLIGIHQFTRIGKHSMTGACSKIVKDVLPFALFSGNPLSYGGLNKIGLRRRGFSEESITELKKAFGFIYNPAYNVTQAVNKIKSDVKRIKEVEHLIEFITKSKRGITK